MDNRKMFELERALDELYKKNRKLERIISRMEEPGDHKCIRSAVEVMEMMLDNNSDWNIKIINESTEHAYFLRERQKIFDEYDPGKKKRDSTQIIPLLRQTRFELSTAYKKYQLQPTTEHLYNLLTFKAMYDGYLQVCCWDPNFIKEMEIARQIVYI
jgi:hypothetical protein